MSSITQVLASANGVRHLADVAISSTEEDSQLSKTDKNKISGVLNFRHQRP